MTNTYDSEIDGVGSVRFGHSRRARRIIISVSPSKGVRVSVPVQVSFKKALEFVHLKKGWIQKHLAIIEQIEDRKKASGIHLQNIAKADAKKRLTERLYYLANKHGFTCNNVTIREQKTRWGSCSPKNNISLNIKLIQLPEALSDYVILHELVHTRIHSHSKKFWSELDRYVKNSKAMAKQLRIDGMMLL
jgi:predicted metal-dependent hydrolase